MISIVNYKRLLIPGILICLMIIFYHMNFKISCKDEDPEYPPLQVHELVHDGIPSFSRLRFQKEEDVAVFESFTMDHVYSANRRSYYDIALPWTPLEAKNRDQVIATALEQSKFVTGGAISGGDFRHGLKRVLPGIGEEYTLVFRSGDDVYTAGVFRKLEGPLVMMTKHKSLKEQPVHIVTPLSGRVDRLLAFLDLLAQFIDDGENLRLTLVAFPDGQNSTQPVEAAVRGWRHAARAHLVLLPGAFSRGLALLRGAAAAAAAAASDADPLLFFCDVDMLLTATELEKCRVHTERGRTVYYPVVFSRYNWRLAAAVHQTPDWMAAASRRVDAGAGDWRDYGFGMSCQFASDFQAISGRYLDMEGWGGEDSALYRRYIKRFRVVRAFDPDIQHQYHRKECSDALATEQYRTCVLSKIANEGSKVQLGLLAVTQGGELGPRVYGVLALHWSQLPAGWAVIALAVCLALSVAANIYQCRLRQRRC